MREKALLHLFSYHSQREMELSTWEESEARQELLHRLHHDEKDVITAVVQYWHLLAAWRPLDRETREESVAITHAPLYDNEVLKKVLTHRSFSLLKKKIPRQWEKCLIERVFYNEVHHHPAYNACQKGEHMKGGEQGLIKALCVDILFAALSIEDHMAYIFPAWVTNKGAVERHFLRDLARWQEPQAILTAYHTILQQHLPSRRSPSTLGKEAHYYQRLVGGVCDAYEAFDATIAGQAPHWNLSRMTFTDRLLLKMALYEIYHVEEIPISVTIYEYLELAKHYSSAKSPAFIHGVLDSIIQQSPPPSECAAPTK